MSQEENIIFNKSGIADALEYAAIKEQQADPAGRAQGQIQGCPDNINGWDQE